ncbi:hypothetical protein H6F74_11115 [Trichocoleus sp. FACHB-90]|uniref:HpsJ-like protein, cyanoexosortase A-associated n=1 Tax=Cyanophyceae TaxID=3028117 RepID=UPI0016880B36|nr:HpsJ family protein [Trichocoleus sp. FACHB-90]MBD1926792.1 hypothetical protein [Trichocoleus sp. FACHB-90]
MNQSESKEIQTISLLRVAGYGLLMLAFFDFSQILVPPRFTNPTWEFQMMGSLVERVPVPLIGMVLVFYGDLSYRRKLEITILKLFSWVSLALGVLFLLLIPLGVNNTWRLYNRNNAQINYQSSQQLSQIQRFKGRLAQATTEEDMNQLFAALNPQERSPEIKNTEGFKKKLLAEIGKAEKIVTTQNQTTRQNMRLSLIKSSLKWNLGALVSATLFVWIWHATRWARRKRSKSIRN